MAAGVVAVLVGIPGIAGADPVISDENLQESISTIEIGPSVQSLETKKTEGKRVTVTISADVLFAFDKAALTAAARKRISQLAPQFKSAVGAIEVSGHSDSIGDPSYNQKLSQQRAEAVKAEITRALGGGKQIRAQGFGETKPVAPNQRGGKDNPEGRAQNRRVEIVFTKP
ncbi:OmpA family protein [Actinomadura darangshiensis]|uniref:OmpA family protein n=1 Tax=Actinomadura darangshiensis TaxID=705336 RepID=UPI001FB6043D|nr:OmpA family protein [Actinomadura darangshiensis]